jgi:FkbM family methyltransferase
MASPLRRAGWWLRKYVLPLVGFWDLVFRLDELRKRTGGLESSTAASHELLSQIQSQIALSHELLSQIQVQIALSHTEFYGRLDRLDERLAGLTAVLTARDGALATTITAEVDRLDAYIAYHSGMLRDRVVGITDDIRPIQQSLLALISRRPCAYTAPGLEAILVAAEYDLLVPTEEVGLIAYLLRHGPAAIEPGVRAVLRDHLRPGAVVVDAGANIGIHSITMALAVGSNGRVVSFEPLPHIAKALSRTLHLNGFGDRIRVQQSALSDTTGEATLYRAAHGPISSLYALPDSIEAEPILVHVITLDECFAPGSRVDFVKMDVEGAEPRVWRGMRRVLRENEDIEVILEWSSSHFRRSGEDPSAFMGEIRAAGFTPFVITDNEGAERLFPFDNVESVEAINVLLTRHPIGRAAETNESAMA